VAFDFEGRRMYLRPNERLSQPHVFDASGVGFIRQAGRHVVYAVISDSVAAVAGVRVGDVLAEIDDRAAASLTPAQLRSLLSADGTTRRLVLEREGQTVTLVLRLKARI
jgi:S1-C subfamily serine protease